MEPKKVTRQSNAGNIGNGLLLPKDKQSTHGVLHMEHYLNAELSAEEAQFREDVHAVLEEAGGPLSEHVIFKRVKHRETQRIVDGMVEDGLMVEVEEGHYSLTKKGREQAALVRRMRQ